MNNVLAPTTSTSIKIKFFCTGDPYSSEARVKFTFRYYDARAHKFLELHQDEPLGFMHLRVPMPKK
jgi:hypothetical protein